MGPQLENSVKLEELEVPVCIYYPSNFCFFSISLQLDFVSLERVVEGKSLSLVVYPLPLQTLCCYSPCCGCSPQDLGVDRGGGRLAQQGRGDYQNQLFRDQMSQPERQTERQIHCCIWQADYIPKQLFNQLQSFSRLPGRQQQLLGGCQN